MTINGITFQIKKSQKGGFIAQDNSYPDSFWIEENSYIDAKIIGKCYIKENSAISKATIINSIIGSNVIIYKPITIKKEIIGDNTKIISI